LSAFRLLLSYFTLEKHLWAALLPPGITCTLIDVQNEQESPRIAAISDPFETEITQASKDIIIGVSMPAVDSSANQAGNVAAGLTCDASSLPSPTLSNSKGMVVPVSCAPASLPPIPSIRRCVDHNATSRTHSLLDRLCPSWIDCDTTNSAVLRLTEIASEGVVQVCHLVCLLRWSSVRFKSPAAIVMHRCKVST
jgi:hypothetical protein